LTTFLHFQLDLLNIHNGDEPPENKLPNLRALQNQQKSSPKTPCASMVHTGMWTW